MDRDKPLVLVTGSRDWNWPYLLGKRLVRLPRPRLTLMQGGAKGADAMAARFGEMAGMEVVTVPAPWKTEGRKAGIIRNDWMLDEQPDLVLAFATDIKTSRGTRHCALSAHERGYPLEIIQPDKPPMKFNYPPLTFQRELTR